MRAPRAIMAAFVALTPGWAAAGALDDIEASGALRCGTGDDHPGFSARDRDGEWQGFHVDFCRALAAAVLGDPTAVEFVALSDKERFRALADGDVDLLSRDTEWTLSRDASLELAFPVTTYFDGQAFMVRRDSGLASAIELSGAPVCVQSGTLAELALARFFQTRGMAYNPAAFESAEETIAAYEADRCAAITAESSVLHAIRPTLARPGDHSVLPEIVSRRPVGPVVAEGDEAWFDVVRWVHFALVAAEELGVTSRNIDDLADTTDQEIRGLLGIDGSFGEDLGLDEGWAAKAIRAVGNYAEIHSRNLGAGSDLKIARGLNALWRDGGLHYAPPLR